MKKETKNNAVATVEKPELTREGPTYAPATDIYEKDDLIVVHCDMPGVALSDVDIRLDNNELEITGTQKQERPEGLDLIMGEYDFGIFRRKFTISPLINREQIKARLRNGVLHLELPKAEQAKPRKIKITAED